MASGTVSTEAKSQKTSMKAGGKQRKRNRARLERAPAPSNTVGGAAPKKRGMVRKTKKDRASSDATGAAVTKHTHHGPMVPATPMQERQPTWPQKLTAENFSASQTLPTPSPTRMP